MALVRVVGTFGKYTTAAPEETRPCEIFDVLDYCGQGPVVNLVGNVDVSEVPSNARHESHGSMHNAAVCTTDVCVFLASFTGLPVILA